MMGQYVEVVIESKCFIVLKLREGAVRVTERSWKTEYSVELGYSSIQWLVKVLEECLSKGKKEVYSATRNGFSSLIAQRCVNRRGRFLEISEYNQGGRRNVICIPEGDNGGGWRKMREKLKEKGMDGSKRVGVHGGGGRNLGSGALRHKNWSYKEALSVNINQRQGWCELARWRWELA
ncbi:hypothetical protein F2P56_006523 [Juglans regia]|uniref:Uncharacterized protein n=1 Tax=Juglans regia TaxID=51240 RepID=A0A834D221_JUGRE|nr:hypothetical protein F2P56_006523 [Juglans regia]